MPLSMDDPTATAPGVSVVELCPMSLVSFSRKDTILERFCGSAGTIPCQGCQPCGMGWGHGGGERQDQCPLPSIPNEGLVHG